jgi:hypothetical protein
MEDDASLYILIVSAERSASFDRLSELSPLGYCGVYGLPYGIIPEV